MVKVVWLRQTATNLHKTTIVYALSDAGNMGLSPYMEYHGRDRVSLLQALKS